MTVGEVVRQYRLRKHWTQGQLAAYTELDQSFISRLENGSVRVASPANLQKIADALDAPLKEILEAAGVTDAPYRPVPDRPAELPGADVIPLAALDTLARLAPLLTPRGWELLLAYAEGLAAELPGSSADLRQALQEALAANLVYSRPKPPGPAPD